jgi:hypothetical protein
LSHNGGGSYASQLLHAKGSPEMQRSPFGTHWRQSSPHLLLLSKFLQPRTVEDFTNADGWQEVLKESPQQAIKRFISDGALLRADLSEHLSYKFKAAELKNMLKQRGLPISGRKDEMISRLVQADPEGMKKAIEGLNLIQCSEQGSRLAESYLNSEKEKRAKVEQQVMDVVKKRAFQEACRLVAGFEAKQVFPRGMNIDWKNYDTSRDVAILNNIFGSLPKQLGNLRPGPVEQFQVAAGMIYLWGISHGKEWAMINKTTGLAFGSDMIIRMLVSYGLYRHEIANYKRIGVKKARILTCNDSYVCGACQELASRTYTLSEIPEVPYEKCTCEFGCRCWIVADEF